MATNANGTGNAAMERESTLLRPSQALARRTAAPRLPGADVSGEQAVRYGYRVGDLGLLIEPGILAEVIGIPRVERIPATPQWLLGICNLRGALVPVFDLHDLFGFASSGDARERAYGLVLDRGENAVGILVDESPRMLAELTLLDTLPPLPALLSPSVANCYLEDGQVWVDLDHRKLFQALGERIAA